MNAWKSFSFSGLLLLLLSACGNQLESQVTEAQTLSIGVGEQKFQTTLYDNETVEALLERLPMTLAMEELNENEKFYYLEEGLPQNPEQTNRVKAGDIMLFGSDCLVIFFKDFDTSYAYTKIGTITDSQRFAESLPEGHESGFAEGQRLAIAKMLQKLSPEDIVELGYDMEEVNQVQQSKKL